MQTGTTRTGREACLRTTWQNTLIPANPAPLSHSTALSYLCFSERMVNYESACTWDICSLLFLDEMLKCLSRKKVGMAREDYLDDIHLRVQRVTEDLRAIQRELNCAAMEAASDPELLEALTQLPEMDSLQVLKSAVDQMRHFLWFYMQIMTNESELTDRLRQAIRQRTSEDSPSPDAALLKDFETIGNSALLRFLTDGKDRKPN